MGHSPTSNTAGTHKGRGGRRQVPSDPEPTDLNPGGQRQTRGAIATHTRGHIRFYSYSHARSRFEDISHDPHDNAACPSEELSNTRTEEQTEEASTSADSRQQPPLLPSDSTVAKIADGSAVSSSSRVVEAERVGSRPPFKVVSARGTPKGPLPIDIQISLLTSVLKHDPFNCPIRRTTQVWERISKEQGIRARTCARRYDNIIQASIAGRDQPSGTEEQIATKKRLLDQLFVMMNQPQAIVRMQKKRRYRSEEADRKLLLETIRLNPFAQKVGQVAKAWEDVRDALGMKVHARQCIRRVNRMIKPYQLRERMYNGNIPAELKEANDELVKQVIQLMYLGGHSGSLEDDGGQSNDEDSVSGASDSDDQDDGFIGSGARKRELPQDDDELEEDEDEKIIGQRGAAQRSSSKYKQESGAITSISSSTPLGALYASSAQTPGGSEALSMASSEHDALSGRHGRSHPSSYSSMDKKKRHKEAGTSDSLQSTQTLESDFRPQRIWGSHPYSKEVLTRSASGSHTSTNRPSQTYSTDKSEQQYDTGSDRRSSAR
ncbi:hypothetical protein BGZ65_012304, partial [Modicella reniformis]